MNSIRHVSALLVMLAALMGVALAMPAGTHADVPRGFTPTYTPTTTSTPTPTVPGSATSTPTVPGPSTPSPTPGPLLPETGDVHGTDTTVIVAALAALVFGLALVPLACSTGEGGDKQPRNAGPDAGV